MTQGSLLTALVAAVLLGGAGVWLGRRAARRRAAQFLAGIRSVADAMARAAAAQRNEILRVAEIEAREEAHAMGESAETVCQAQEAALVTRARRLAQREGDLAAASVRASALTERAEALRARIAGHEGEAARRRAERAALDVEARGALESAAGESAEEAAAALRAAEIDDARLDASRAERAATEALADGAVRGGKRVLAIASGRFQGHYLTERLHSTVPIIPPHGPGHHGPAHPKPNEATGPAGVTVEGVLGPDQANLRAIEAVAGVTLSVSERGDAIRLEGLDGVGREIARRAIAHLQRDPRLGRDAAAVTRVARDIATRLGRELVELGQRAFATLEIPAAHADIVALVGRLNYRTSYTQNQWKHAVEAGFLCGMMADEMGLDRQLARRAALMHDIGKALTHELDGSHAVIGADYARRLGEPEVVANAIGAHHTDEPFSSPYAYLVAAADAMSGARPGARRQTDDNYLARIEDLERISRGFRGVAEAFAVQGGREVRIYVAEDRVDDLGAVNLSSAIAAKISEEMRFPGQIRVTVIRELKAVEVAS